MKLLLDTHSLIWFFSGEPKLSNTARIYIEEVKHQKFISLATVWEMAIKQSKNKCKDSGHTKIATTFSR